MSRLSTFQDNALDFWPFEFACVHFAEGYVEVFEQNQNLGASCITMFTKVYRLSDSQILECFSAGAI